MSLVAVLAWRPWQGPGRKQWSAAPAVPARPTPAERVWLGGLAAWIAYVRDAGEDPTGLTLRDCGARLDRLDLPPKRLRETRSLAADTCAALAAQASDRAASGLSLDPNRAGRANAEEREGARDLQLLLVSLKLRAPPGGRVVAAYSRIASRLSGRDATVRCWDSEKNWQAVESSLARTEPRLRHLAGFAVPWLSRVELSPTVCRVLAGARTRHPLSLVSAVEVLTHESEHLAGPDGISNEAKTDCYAAQRMSLTARLLGIRDWNAPRLARFYLEADQPSLPAQYRSPACRSRGRYDLTPRDGTWP